MKIEILQRQIKIKYNWLDGNKKRELDDADKEHILHGVEMGYFQGELEQIIDKETGETTRGWWKKV